MPTANVTANLRSHTTWKFWSQPTYLHSFLLELQRRKKHVGMHFLPAIWFILPEVVHYDFLIKDIEPER
jgi:hypothetical protein